MVNDINHAHTRRVVEAFEVLLREILHRAGEDMRNSENHPFFLFPSFIFNTVLAIGRNSTVGLT